MHKTLQQVRIYLGDDKYTMRHLQATWKNGKNQYKNDHNISHKGKESKINKQCSHMRYTNMR